MGNIVIVYKGEILLSTIRNSEVFGGVVFVCFGFGSLLWNNDDDDNNDNDDDDDDDDDDR